MVLAILRGSALALAQALALSARATSCVAKLAASVVIESAAKT
jgi:hypothetical protein